MELQVIQNKIYEIRGHRVMLDADLAELYGVETRVLKQAVRRNNSRFPTDFLFELTQKETDNLRSQFVTSLSSSTRYTPFAFTEQGVAMLASVLKSPQAIELNIQIVRAFVQMRQFALTNSELADRLAALEGQFSDVSEAINYLLQKDSQEIEYKERTRIGYKNVGE